MLWCIFCCFKLHIFPWGFPHLAAKAEEDRLQAKLLFRFIKKTTASGAPLWGPRHGNVYNTRFFYFTYVYCFLNFKLYILVCFCHCFKLHIFLWGFPTWRPCSACRESKDGFFFWVFFPCAFHCMCCLTLEILGLVPFVEGQRSFISGLFLFAFHCTCYICLFLVHSAWLPKQRRRRCRPKPLARAMSPNVKCLYIILHFVTF
jgi:hypothetical protein